MANATEKDGQDHASTEVARLVRHGVQPLDVLVELAACHCLLTEQPRVATSDRARAFALSRAVLGLAPRPRVLTRDAAAKGSSGYARQPKAAALASIGPTLVATLAPLLVTSLQHLQTEDQRARAEVDAMRQPFPVSPEVLARVAAEASPSIS